MSTYNEWIFDMRFLVESASRRDGVDMEKEKELRSKSIWFIEDLAAELRCETRKVVSTAAVFFHRFYAFHSFKKHNRFFIALSCLFLAAKAEERPIKLKDAVNAYFLVRNRLVKPTEAEVKDLHKNLLTSERILLQTLNFDLNVVHPYTALFNKAREMKQSMGNSSTNAKDLHEYAVNFVNDSFRTTLCLQYNPQMVALAAAFMASIQMEFHLKADFPSDKLSPEAKWFETTMERDIDEMSLKTICYQILAVYQPKMSHLAEEVVDHLRSRIMKYSTAKVSNLPSGDGDRGHFSDDSDDRGDDTSRDAEDDEEDGKQRSVIVTVVKTAQSYDHAGYKRRYSFDQPNSTTNSGNGHTSQTLSAFGGLAPTPVNTHPADSPASMFRQHSAPDTPNHQPLPDTPGYCESMSGTPNFEYLQEESFGSMSAKRARVE